MLEMRTERDKLVVAVQGDLDMATAKDFRDRVDGMLLMRPGIQQLLVDLSAVGFIDSSGLGVIIGRYKLMQDRGGQMALTGAGSNVYRILEMSGIKKLMPIAKGEAKAKK